jgi:hypothetical protein
VFYLRDRLSRTLKKSSVEFLSAAAISAVPVVFFTVFVVPMADLFDSVLPVDRFWLVLEELVVLLVLTSSLW